MSIREVFVIDGNRTPLVKAGGAFKDVAAPFLGINLLKEMMNNHSLLDDQIDEVIFGNTGTPPAYSNLARVIALYSGLHPKTPAVTVHRNCASGLEAIAQGFLKISASRSDLLFVGGAESMSQMPILYGKEMTDLFIDLMKAKTILEKLTALTKFRPSFLKPKIALLQGLRDPISGLMMGRTVENLVREMNITRREQDEYTISSHQKADSAITKGRFDQEIVPTIAGPLFDQMITHDIGKKDNCTMEMLAKLPPYFDKSSGTITIGNSCSITDGGAALLLASSHAVTKSRLTPIAKVVDYSFDGLDPARMGMGPLLSINTILKRNSLTMADIALFEINEAFAAQVLAVLKGFEDDKISQMYGLEKAPGRLDRATLNVNGGGLALGHPVGATGARISVTLLHELIKRKEKFGIASLCVGGGQGGAILFENLMI